MNPLTQIIYVSSAKRLMSESELLELLEESRNANAEHNVTGLLLYNRGNFMQAIEGNKNEVEQLIENIKNDKRHTGMIVLVNTPIPERDFPDWTMGFHNLSLSDVDGFTDFFRSHSEKEKDIRSGIAKSLLLEFRKSPN